MIRFVPPFRGRYIASISGGVTENIARVGVAIGVTCAATVVHDASASASVSVSAQAKGHFTYFAIADVTISATAAGQRTVSGTGNIGIDITSTADGGVFTAHSGVATVGVTIEATAAATIGTTHSNSTAECQVNISTSANGYNISDTIPDETANGNNLVMSGTTWTFDTDAAIGTRSVSFATGSNYGLIDESYLSVFGSPWSYSCWYKPSEGAVGSSNTPELINTGINSSGSSGGSYYKLVHTLQKLYWVTRIDTSYGETFRRTSSNVFSSGSGNDWIHIVVTLDNVGDPTMYIDGSEVTLDTDSTPNTLNISNYSNDSDVRIGAFSQTEGDYNIDDVSIWSTELTSTQVSNLYNSGSGTDLTGSSNLAGWWKMGDSNVVLVTYSGTATVSVDVTASASGNTFTAHSGTASCQVNLSASASGTASTPWANSYSIDLDGTNDYVDVDTFDPYDQIGTGDFTISLWVKPDSVHSAVISSWLDGTSNDYGQCRLVLRSDGKWRISWKGTSGTNLNTDSTATYSAGNWYNVIITRSGQQCYVYVNDSQIISVNATQVATGFVDNGEFNIGRYRRSYNGSWLNGHVDEYAIWDEVLTSAERTAIYNSGAPIDLTSDSGNYASSANLVGYWRFEENSGTSIADSSSNSNSATLVNGPTFSTDVPS